MVSVDLVCFYFYGLCGVGESSVCISIITAQSAAAAIGTYLLSAAVPLLPPVYGGGWRVGFFGLAIIAEALSRKSIGQDGYLAGQCVVPPVFNGTQRILFDVHGRLWHFVLGEVWLERCRRDLLGQEVVDLRYPLNTCLYPHLSTGQRLSRLRRV